MKALAGVLAAGLAVAVVAWFLMAEGEVPMPTAVTAQSAIQGAAPDPAAAAPPAQEEPRTVAVVDTQAAEPVPAKVNIEVPDGPGPWAIITGTVKLPDGSPAANVEVSLFSASVGEMPFAAEQKNNMAEVRTNEAGVYTGVVKDGPLLFALARAGDYAPGDAYSQNMEFASKPSPPNGRREVRMGDITLKAGVAARGVVVDESGVPVADARVAPQMQSMASLLDSMATTTDAAGRFELRGLLAQELHVVARKEGYVPARGKFQGEAEDIRLVLTRGGASVAGTVRMMATKEPVAGASVSIFPYGGFGMDKPTTATTAADGSYRFEMLAAGTYGLVAAKDTFTTFGGSNQINLAEKEVQTGVFLDIYSGHSILGKVVDGGGGDKPLEGVLVRIQGQMGTLAGQKRLQPVKTDAEGAFRFDGVIGTGVVLDAQLDGYTIVQSSTPWDMSNRMVTLGEELEARYTLRMVRGVTVSGRVVNEAKMPVPNATVTWTTQYTMGNSTSTKVSADGTFSIAVSPESGGAITAEAPGTYTAKTDFIRVQNKPITDIEIVIGRGATIVGEVIGPDDEPMPGADVKAIQYVPIGENMRRHQEIPAVKSDAEGKFVVSNVGPGETYVLAEKKGFSQSPRETVTLQMGERKTGVVLRLGKSHYLGGYVVTGGGDPVAEANIYIHTPNGNFYRHGVTTDAKGRFFAEELPAGPLYVQVSKDQDWEQFPDLEVDKDDHKLVLGKTNRMKIVYTVVDGETKQPIAAGTFNQGQSFPSTGTSFKDGTFTHEGVREGFWYEFTIKAEGYADYGPEGFVAKAEEDGVIERRAELFRGGTMTGRVIDRETRAAVANVRVESMGPEYNPWNQRQGSKPVYTDAEGRFSIGPLNPGRNTLQFTPDAPHTTRRAQGTVTNKANTDLGDVELSTGAKLIVKVIQGSARTPIPDKQVTATMNSRERRSFTGTTGADGVHTFTGLPTGSYQLSAGASTAFVEELRDDDQREVILTLGSLTLRGKVLQNGKPMAARLELRAVREGTVNSNGATSGESGYEVKDLVPGLYTINVRSAQTYQQIMQEELDIRADMEHDIVVPTGMISGTVVDGAGKGVADAQVSVATASEDQRGAQISAADDGVYTLRNLAAGDIELIAQTGDGLIGRKKVSLAAGEEKTGVTITLEGGEKGKLVSVALRLTDGLPIERAWCRVTGVDDPTIRLNAAPRNKQGETSMELAPGRYKVNVSHWGHSEGNREVTIVAGQTTTIEDVLYEAGSMKWIVVARDGSPLAGLQVSLQPVDSDSIEEPRTGTTNRNGFYETRGLFPGEYIATATTPSGQTLSANFRIDAHSHTERTSREK